MAACSKIRPIVKQIVNLDRFIVYHSKINDASDFFDILERLRIFSFFEKEDDLNAAVGYLQSVQATNPSLKIYCKSVDVGSGALQDADLAKITSERLDDSSLAVYQKYGIDEEG